MPRISFFLALLLLIALVAASACAKTETRAADTGATVTSADVPRINIDEAVEMADKPNVVFVDVRSGKTWSDSDSMVRRARRLSVAWDVPLHSAHWDKDMTYILYCA